MKDYPAFYLLAVSIFGISGYLHAENQPWHAPGGIFLSGEVCAPFGRAVDDPRMKLAAVTDGNLEPLRQYLREGGKVNGRLSNGMSLLEVAVQYGGDDVVEYLISQGAEVRKRDAKGRSLGTLAAMQGRTKVLNMLLNASPEPPNLEEMWIPLFQNAMEVYMWPRRSRLNSNFSLGTLLSQERLNPVFGGDRMGVLRVLLERGVDPEAGSGEITALGAYAMVGDVEAVKLLLSFHANVNALSGNFNKVTPLMLAAPEGHSEVVRLLFQAGADKRAVDSRGFPVLAVYMEQKFRPLDDDNLWALCSDCDESLLGGVLVWAKMGGAGEVENVVWRRCAMDKSARLAVFGALCRKRIKNSAFHIEDQERKEILLGLLKQGIDVVEMQTALKDAVHAGLQDVIRLLLEHGADPHVVDEQGRTLLMLAVLSPEGNAMKNTELLIQYGVDAEARDAEGKTAAMMAEARGFSTLSGWIRECREKYAKTAVRNAVTASLNEQQ
ncbi:ankyrin repeat domain-containing protein [Akkermansia glycaniphila]|uniref:ankyrin repeat domain-containing protein n=1 Tax=Akkermansia glycaniphila TaxID=1679444 RepID=UPI001C035071|nr:ankyrin repeat domain-containing protein [Akkermansia glycaniphila]MBT9449096.1 ankyrin repeat domain-containing protein [Akkermansia glycaniphila]